MNTALLVVLASSLWPFGNSGQTVKNRYLVPAWHVDTVLDRFTNRTACRVYQGAARKPSVSYARGTLAFAFPRSRNIINADFRVDDGPARPWTSVYPAVVGSGATLAGKSMTNPTQGLVIIPVATVAGATTVTIRSRPDDKPRVFSVGGLQDAMAAARRLGCDPGNGFVRPL